MGWNVRVAQPHIKQKWKTTVQDKDMEHVKLHDMSPPKKYIRIMRVWIWI